MSNRTLIVGNWKMHLNTSQASLLLHRLHERIRIHRDVEVVLAPSMLVLQPLSTQIDRRKFRLAAQNAYDHDEGTYTGEVSFTMLRELVHYVIVGHSERRNVFGETLDNVRDKMSACVRNGIVPILCVGETQADRLAGETTRVLHDQVTTAVSNLTAKEVQDIVVAYEPVWAIGTGRAAIPDDATHAAATIRSNIAELYGKRAAESVRVLYGGSVKADLAGGFLGKHGVDGLLVGGASLNYHEFSGIVDSAFKVRSHRS